ncbi:MAG: DUF1549 and DUF1553 domain-containing protein, partial [Gemmataceae bacterium]|nr:DUF1549 and DUF1553 domain-containing protein [Gemmataceae bacterium]
PALRRMPHRRSWSLCAISLSLTVSPPEASLLTSRGTQVFTVQATYADGLTRDVTAKAKAALVDPKLAKIDGNVLKPLADGETQLVVEHEGKSARIPVKVKDAAKDRPISFKLDVMPIFMRAGCNQGGCHGAARGKDGFRLSLFGFDPDGDHYRLTREAPGRRINIALPEESLLVEKSTGAVPHTGGQRIKKGDHLYADLVRWMEAKAPLDAPTIPTVTGLEIYPKNAVLDGKGETQQMTVQAKYSDGSLRDVTKLALFLSNNDTSAKIGEDGKVTAGDRGEAFVMARFSTFTVGSQVIVLPKGLKFEWPKVEEKNYIDTLVHDKLKKLRILPGGVCDDETFLRRVYLDVVGVLPTAEEYGKFMSSKETGKREKLVDELLGRKEFAELWVLKWAELLQIRSSQQVSYKAMLLYYDWLQERIAKNVPVNEWVQELLGASGGTFKSPATNYYQNETDILKVSENVAQVFMGMRTQCAQCHNHPFDRWTMDDYYGFAAFFSQIGRKGADDPREQIVFNSRGGEVAHPVKRVVMKPKFLGGIEPDMKGEDRRKVLAKWLASPDNPYFATNLANRVWHHFFGVGIIDEIDDVRISNPASNPELLAAMGKKFTEYKYDFKKMVRDICNSRTYQLSTQGHESSAGDTRNYARSYLRRIKAETFLDCISQVTETKNKFPGLPNGARAVQIADGSVSTYFLTTFGRPMRETVCGCEVRLEPTLSQSLHLLNGDSTGNRISSGGLIAKRLGEKKTPAQIIEELYVRTLTRKPTKAEAEKLLALLRDEKDQRVALEDVFWSLLNSREFMFNH